MKQKIENNLAEFLKENNALDQFIENQPDLTFNPSRELGSIIKAFDWEDTPKGQGNNYWYELHYKFNSTK
jgi:hypothetical protein